MPAVVAMSVRRVPAGVEQPSRSAPVRFFLGRFKIGQYRQARLTGVVLYEATFTAGSRMAV
jgi:hypothetical protein